MKRVAALAAAAGFFLWGCGSAPTDISYNPAQQLLPHHVQKIALHMSANKTQQFGMEDKLTLDIRDQFLADGNYAIVPDKDADGIVEPTITRYLLTPTSFNQNLAPTAYKLIILLDLQFVDRRTNTILWDQPNIEGTLSYADATVPNGITEEQAREQIYLQLAQDVVTRVVEGFGSVTGEASRVIASSGASTAPPTLPAAPLGPVTHPY